MGGGACSVVTVTVKLAPPMGLLGIQAWLRRLRVFLMESFLEYSMDP